MTHLLIILLSVLVALNLPAAVSNRTAEAGVSATIPDATDPVEKEFKRLMEQDDEAQAEVDKWIRDNNAFAQQGAGTPAAELNQRILKRFAAVRKGYEDFITRHPHHARVRVAYASFLSDIGEEAAAFTHLEKARELDPNDPATWNNLANYHGHNGPVTKAFEYYEKAIALNSKEPVYYQNFGTTVFLFRKDAMEHYRINEQQVFDKALVLYREAMKLDPNDLPLASDVALTYYGIKPPQSTTRVRGAVPTGVWKPLCPCGAREPLSTHIRPANLRSHLMSNVIHSALAPEFAAAAVHVSRNDRWYEIINPDDVDSPALLVYPERTEENIRRMIAMVGDVSRLRPHMKTHKLPELIRLQLAHGITKFKCATIAEAEMTAACGAADVLLAHQPIGPKVRRFVQLVQKFPQTKFSTIADDAAVIRALSAACLQAGVSVEVLLDIDCGMHRTGIEPGPRAMELYRLLGTLPGLKSGGLHAYDGHIRESDPAKRAELCEAALAPVRVLRQDLLKAGLPVPQLVAGGTPTFPMHARHTDVECSPGTCVFWDAGYDAACADMDFLHAALVLTRVVSKPGGNRLCLDLGHKAIASENPHPRVVFLNLPEAKAVSHSEEHLVVETERAGEFELGACLYGVPWHVCPTVALHPEAVVVRDGRAQERWEVVGRMRRLSV